MSKIVMAMNVMVSNPSLITDVIKGVHDSEVFFKYDSKHVWSLFKNTGANENYVISFYPNTPDINSLAMIPDETWDSLAPQHVTYSSKELATVEARESMRDLYGLLNEKLFGIDDVLDEIIATDVPF